MVACFASAIYGWSKGDPNILLLGWDSDQNGCGYSDSTIDYPYLYWPKSPDKSLVSDVEKGDTDEIFKLLEFGVCVKECPATDEDKIECKPTKYMKEADQLEYYEDCEHYPLKVVSGVPFRFPSKSFAGHFCIPDGEYTDSEKMYVAFKEAFYESALGNKGTAYFYDIYKCWAVLLIGSLITCIFAYLYLFVVRWVGGIIIWASIILTFVVLICAGCYSYFYARLQYPEDNPTHDYIAYASYVIFGIAGLLLLTVMCCFSAIALGIAVFKATANYLQCNMEVFILPAVSTLISLIWYVVWISAAIFIFSVGTPTAREGAPYITEIMWDDNTRYILLYFCFCLLWVNAFIVGCVQFIIGASTCLWYFTVKTDTGGKGTIRIATWWLFRYHWASVGLGSLIIAICQMIRIIFEYYRKKAGAAAAVNPVLKFTLWATSYCLLCLEKCIKYISKNAYIQIALTNDSFLPAAINAFCLILKNAHRFGIANSIGGIFMFFGCFLLTSISCFGSYMFLTNYGVEGLEITSPIPATFAMGVIAIGIGYQFLSIFSFSQDAILQSYLLDEELRRPSTASRPDDI